VIDLSREVLRDKIYRALPDYPYASILVALVIGEQSEVAQTDWKLFNRTGIGHLVSISGLHITMVAGLFASLAGMVWRQSWFFGAGKACLLVPAQTVSVIRRSLNCDCLCCFGRFRSSRTTYSVFITFVCNSANLKPA